MEGNTRNVSVSVFLFVLESISVSVQSGRKGHEDRRSTCPDRWTTG
jgi:hypothetical protein